MNLQKFDLKTVVDMDNGRIREAIEQAIRRCELDCKDRPNLEGKRTVTLKINLEPVPDEEGNLDSVNVGFSIGDALPRRASKKYNMKAGRGGLVFNEMSPHDVNQATLPGMGPQGEDEEQEENEDVG